MSRKRRSRARDSGRHEPALQKFPWVLPAGLLFLAALVAYWNSFRVPLVFDDLLTIQRNAGVRFGEFHWGLAGRAVLYLTFTLNHVWSGQEVWSYHFINFCLHFLNGLLVFLLAEQVFRHVEINEHRRRLYAGLAAAFFLVHPVQTESVTYISSRSELLSTFFYLLGLLTFVLWPEGRIGFFCSFAVAIPYAIGLGSKETAITLPAAIFLYDFLFLARARLVPILTRWRFYLTYILGASGAIYYLLTRVLKVTVTAPQNLSPWHYFLTQTRVLVRYVQLIFLPVGLNLDYDFRPSSSLLEPSVVASIAILTFLFLLGWYLRQRAPVFAFSILWFFITLSPTSSVVPIVDVIFEHRLYLPLAGVCISFPGLVELVYRKLRDRIAIPATAVAWSFILLIALTTGTVMRNYVWADEVRLFTDVVAKSPGKERAYNGLAWALYKRAEYERAIEVLRNGLHNVPDKTNSFSETLSQFYLKTGRYQEAVEALKRNVEVGPPDLRAVAYNDLGVAYLYMWNDLQARRTQFSAGEYASRAESILKPAADAFLQALKLDPGMDSALDSYVNAMCYRGRAGEIEAEALERLRSKEEFNALYTVGKAAFNGNDYAKADAYFERAEKVNPNVKIMFFNHGYALAKLGQEDRAIEKYIQAIRIEPIFIEAYHNLGQIYLRRREYAKAEEAFREVLRQDPRHISSNLNLASIYMALGRKMQARERLQTVLEASPGNQQAVTMLAQLGS